MFRSFTHEDREWMMTRFPHKVGLFGGAGPWASAHAALTIVQRAQWDYAAVEDEDYPEFILRSVPLRGFGARGIEDRARVREQVLSHFRRFAEDGVDIALMACNSLYAFYDELQAQYPAMTIVHLPAVGADAVAQRGYKRVGLLCSQSASDDHLHTAALSSRNVDAVFPAPAQQEKINHLIYCVMGGNTGAQEAQVFRQLSREFADAGASVLLSGCTELSYLSHKFQSDLPVIDCLYEAINLTLRLASSRKKV